MIGIKTNLYVALIAIALLQEKLGYAQAPIDAPCTTETIPILNDAGTKVLGKLELFRSENSGKIESLHYSAPVELIVKQKQDWSHWSKHNNLREIHIALTDFTSSFGAYISTIKGLRSIRVESCKIEKNALSSIGKMADLTELELLLSFPIEDWRFLQSMNGLRVLSVSGANVNASFVDMLPTLQGLTEIHIYAPRDLLPTVFVQISKLKNIQFISVGVMEH